ncbi:hypothetical protein GCM10022217_04580 [Chryseobacterium ginsenosidimutans]|uniref:hypothetical protein n=1 Tax=Chryseobacterium ginsenosidimutans TaxID=687846 RepID=UPI0031DCFD05
MELPEFNFLTEKSILKLKCIDIVEPNNGRMLYKVDLFLNNKNVTEEYFGKWNYINFYLTQYSPNNNDWIYIPKEGEHFLIKISTLEKVELPYIPLSAATFIKNIFVHDYLIILCSDQIIFKNLINETVIKIDKGEKDAYFNELSILDSGKIEIILNDKSSKIISLNI